MPDGVASLVLLGLAGSLGFTLLVLACALPQFNNYWPLLTLAFHALAPVPYTLIRRHAEATADGKMAWCRDAAVFLTAGTVVSAYGLPLLLAHAPLAAPVIRAGACALVLAGNVVLFLTLLGLVMLDSADDGWY